MLYFDWFLGSWPIWINFREESQCDGSETRIEECHEKQLWSHDDHYGMTATSPGQDQTLSINQLIN